MALDSMAEIFEKAEAGGKPFWQVVLDTDMEERQVTAEASLEKMRATWRAMLKPTLPASEAFIPHSDNMWWVSRVVVVLPLAPVMPILRALVYRPANSISDITGTPFSRRATTTGAVSGMPGLFIARSAAMTLFSVCPPSSKAMPALSSSWRYSSFSVPLSLTKTS